MTADGFAVHNAVGGLRLLGRWGLSRMRSLPIALVSLLIGLWAQIDNWLAYTAAAWLMLALLRYVDDVADRVRDRQRHPQRVLPQATGQRVAAAGMMLLALVLGALLLLLGRLPLGAIALGIGAAIYYPLRAYVASEPESLIWRHLLMLKYPALLWALRPMIGWPPLLALLGGAALYELAHDRRCRRAQGFMGWLAADAAMLAAAGLWFLQN